MSTGQNVSASDKLLLAAIDLMAEKGFNGVTTKEIAAAAGVNEVTLFRNFGTKQNLLEAAYHRFHYGEDMKKLFGERLAWELETDLLLISRTYHAIMWRNRKMLRIGLKESHILSEFREKARKHPMQLKELLMSYFSEMAKRGKVAEGNPETQALSFMWMNYGAAVSNLHTEEEPMIESMDTFITESVRLFARALTPGCK